jgi:glycosyltransferase involved in cell wall biosynthesis
MRVLQVLTYYRPYISGYTIYVERLSRALVQAGHQVTVLASQYDPQLPLRETVDGVQIVRVPVAMRVSKGVIMPTFGNVARKLIREHDIVHTHLPQFDAAGLAVNARLLCKPSLLTYHCDITLPPSLIKLAVQPVIETMNQLAARFINCIVAYTADYAKHSRLVSGLMHKVRVIPPPVEIPIPTSDDVQAFRQKFGLSERPVIGMCARLATEKGAEVLADALEIVRKTLPTAQVVFAGTYQNVLGEEEYGRRILARVETLNVQGRRWTFTGPLHGRELAAFYANNDVFVTPSLNSTESFGMAQVESMLCGVPSICSGLPGVRVPVQTTGMGQVVPIGDAAALAQAILEVLADRERYVKPRDFVESHYSTVKTVAMYEALYGELLARS